MIDSLDFIDHMFMRSTGISKFLRSDSMMKIPNGCSTHSSKYLASCEIINDKSEDLFVM